jgi:hypothetical protein
MSSRSNRKLLASLCITTILVAEASFMLVPHNSSAQGAQQVITMAGSTITASHTAADTPRTITENVVNPAIKALVKGISSIFLQSLAGWVRSGFRGAPQFVDNPEQFFKNLARNGQINHQLQLMATKLCYPMGQNFSGPQAALQTPSFQGYPSLKCTMKTPNVQGFFDDFSNGSWQTYGEVSEPHNNVYGMLALIGENEAVEMEKKMAQGNSEMIASQGFLGIKQCAVSAIFKAAVDGENFTQESCAQMKNVTPGSVVGSKITANLNQDVASWVDTHALGDIVGALINDVLNKLIGTKFMCLSCGSGNGTGGTTGGGGSTVGRACYSDASCGTGAYCAGNGTNCACASGQGPGNPACTNKPCGGDSYCPGGYCAGSTSGSCVCASGAGPGNPACAVSCHTNAECAGVGGWCAGTSSCKCSPGSGVPNSGC